MSIALAHSTRPAFRWRALPKVIGLYAAAALAGGVFYIGLQFVVQPPPPSAPTPLWFDRHRPVTPMNIVSPAEPTRPPGSTRDQLVSGLGKAIAPVEWPYEPGGTWILAGKDALMTNADIRGKLKEISTIATREKAVNTNKLVSALEAQLKAKLFIGTVDYDHLASGAKQTFDKTFDPYAGFLVTAGCSLDLGDLCKGSPKAFTISKKIELKDGNAVTITTSDPTVLLSTENALSKFYKYVQ